MKNVLKGGLKSLIPNHDIEDADDILDEIEDEETDQEEEIQESEPDNRENQPVKSRKVNIVSEDEEVIRPKAFDENANEENQAPDEQPAKEPAPPKNTKNEETSSTYPPAPKVTPLRIDMDDDEEEIGSTEEENEGSVNQESGEEKEEEKQNVQTKTNRLKQVSVETEENQENIQEEYTEKPQEEEQPSQQEPQILPEKEKTPQESIWDKHEEDVQHVNVAEIKVNPNQPRHRFNDTEMEELKNSIAKHGILQPLVVRRSKDRMELIAGERRLRAAKLLGWEKVPCVIRRDVTSGASRLEMALIENIQREDLNTVEEAMAYKQLNEEYGMTHEEIGERVGRSRVGITNVIRVLQLHEEIQKGLIDGKISSGHAKAILMIPDEEKQLRFYRHLVEEGLTVRKAETRARRIQRTMRLDDPLRNRRRGRSQYEVKYSGLLEDRYGYSSRVKFDEHKNRYEVTFRCYSKEEADQLVGRLMGKEELPSPDEDD